MPTASVHAGAASHSPKIARSVPGCSALSAAIGDDDVGCGCRPCGWGEGAATALRVRDLIWMLHVILPVTTLRDELVADQAFSPVEPHCRGSFTPRRRPGLRVLQANLVN